MRFGDYNVLFDIYANLSRRLSLWQFDDNGCLFLEALLRNWLKSFIFIREKSSVIRKLKSLERTGASLGAHLLRSKAGITSSVKVLFLLSVRRVGRILEI